MPLKKAVAQRYALSLAGGALIALSLNAIKINQRTVFLAGSLTTYYAIYFSKRKSNERNDNGEYLDIKLDSEDNNENIKIYTAAIAKEPGIAENYLKRGIAYSDLKEKNLALEDLEKVISFEPENLAAIAYLASCKGALGDIEGCIASFSDILKIRPNDRNALSSIGAIYYGSDDFKNSIDYFDKIYKLNKNDAEAVGFRGLCKFKLSDSKGAIEDLDKSLDQLPDDHEYSFYFYMTRGEAKADTNDDAGAINDFNKTIELDPEHAEAYKLRGCSRFSMGYPKEALTDLDRALAIDPELNSAYFSRAIARQQSGMYKESVLDWTKCIELKNDFYFAYAKRAESNCGAEKYSDVINDCDFLIANNQEMERALNCRAHAHNRLGQLDKAVSDYRAAYNINKQLGYIYNAGLAYHESEMYTDSILIYNEIISIDPDYSAAYMSRGVSEYYQRDFDAALKDWERASAMGNQRASEILELEEIKALEQEDPIQVDQKFKEDLLSDYEKLANWCKQQDAKEAEGLSLDLMFTITTIIKAKEEMISVGWNKSDINNLPISTIYPIVSQFQTNVLNMLGVNGNELIENRDMLLYDEIIVSELKIPRERVQLNEWWPEYYNMTLRKMWNK